MQNYLLAPGDELYGDELLGLPVPHQPGNAEVAGPDIAHNLILVHGTFDQSLNLFANIGAKFRPFCKFGGFGGSSKQRWQLFEGSEGD